MIRQSLTPIARAERMNSSLAQRQHRTAHQAGILHPLRDDQQDDRVGEPAADDGNEGDGEQDEGERQLDIGKTHHQHVPDAAVIPGDQPHDDADGDAAGNRDEADQQRDLAAGHHAGEHVASERIGAENMCRPDEWRYEARHQVDLFGAAGKDHAGKDDGNADDADQQGTEDKFEFQEIRGSSARGHGSHSVRMRGSTRP